MPNRGAWDTVRSSKTGKYGYSPGSPSKCTVIRSSTSIILYKHGGYNKHFSSRNFAILGEDGSPCGYARTIWVVIDLDSRTSVDISQFEYIAENISDKACPIEKQSRVRDVHDENAVIYPVTYNDIDLNRHVNSVKYIEHELDLFPFERYDKQRIRRFEISYANEARYGSTLQLLKEEEAPDHFTLEIRDDQTVYCKGRIIFENR